MVGVPEERQTRTPEKCLTPTLRQNTEGSPGRLFFLSTIIMADKYIT